MRHGGGRDDHLPLSPPTRDMWGSQHVPPLQAAVSSSSPADRSLLTISPVMPMPGPLRQRQRTRSADAAGVGASAGAGAGSGVSVEPAKKPKPRRRRLRGYFPCSKCGRVFGRNYNLTAHGLTHDPEQPRPFVCPVKGCDKAFARKYDAQRHYRKLHVNQGSLPPEWVDRIVDSRFDTDL